MDTLSRTRRLESSETLLRKPQISQYLDYVLKRIVDIFLIRPVYVGILCNLCVHIFELQRNANVPSSYPSFAELKWYKFIAWRDREVCY